MTHFSMPGPVAPRPSRQAALQAIAAIRPAQYARTRNHLSGAVTGLSPYLTHGIVTLPEVLAGVLEREPLAVDHKLVYELGWREFFRHVWSCEGDGILTSIHPGPLPDAMYARALAPDIRQGRTGVPVIDEAVRYLYTTGTLHNHARMWLASYVVHLRSVHWRAGADWLISHLLDGDLASNHLSWQWVAGTGSHKPYLFNAENVARYAPPQWHSPGTVVDQSYEALDALARDPNAAPSPAHTDAARADTLTATEPPLMTEPPADLGIGPPDATRLGDLEGREVWLVHPWALRAPPADLAADACVLGVYLREHHAAWPWTEARWRWVDAAMREVTTQRCLTDAPTLTAALRVARRVRAVADPHVTRWLAPFVRLEAAPTLFAHIEPRCRSFSQWWTRATRGHQRAEELL